MKPFVEIWATNPNHAAGVEPWSGQPNKIPPASGKLATGRVPEERPPAEETNYWRHQVSRLLSAVASERLVNFDIEDISLLRNAGYLGLNPHACGHGGLVAPQRHLSVCVSANAGSIPEAYYCYTGQRVWRLWGAIPGGGSRSPQGIASDLQGVVAQTLSIPSDCIYWSAAPGAPWMPWAFAAPLALSWADIACSQDPADTIWVAMDSMSSSPIWSPGPGTAWAAAATPPGFISSPSLLVHSHHRAGDRYPSDPGNPLFMALTETQISTSADGNVWTPAVAHGFSAPPLSHAYSRVGMKWIAILARNPGSRIATTLDNGATWSESDSIDTAVNLAGGSSWARLTCDGWGHWIVVVSNGSIIELHASTDNGETWHRIWTEQTASFAPIPNFGTIWYGNGAFGLMTTGGPRRFFSAASHRVIEL